MTQVGQAVIQIAAKKGIKTINFVRDRHVRISHGQVKVSTADWHP